jgi:hypothetical protein
MTKADELLALAERVMALTGPCRETDAHIAVAIRYFPKGVGFVWQAELRANSPETGRVECCTNIGTGGPHYAAPAFTASLDAAMTLAPDGYDWAVFHTNGGLTMHAWCGNREDVFADTPALALCAAALLARAAMEEGR